MQQTTFKSLSVGLACALLIAGCGGGGSGTPVVVDTTAPKTDTPTATSLDLKLNDTLVTAFTGTGFGIWTGDGGNDSGGLDAGGAAGDGEFVKVSATFPNAASTQGTLTWTILRSQYGKTGSTGSLTIQRETDTTKGGYKVVGGSSTQSNFFVSASGQISGTLPLPIGTGGAIQDTLFNGARFKDTAAASLADVAGIYGYGGLGKVIAGVGSGSSLVPIGTMKINADGTGRVCPDTPFYSDTCANGDNLSVAFDDPTSKNLLRIRQAAGVNASLDVLAVVKAFNGGMSMTGDYVLTDNGVTETGALYASKVRASALSAASLVGAWNLTGTDVGSGPSPVKVNLKAAIGVAGNAVKSAVQGPNGCFFNTLTSGPVNGALTVTEYDGVGQVTSTGFAMLLDADSAVFIEPDVSISLARRYSSDPTSTGACQPQ